MVVRGLDRIAGTPQEGLSDEAWARHKAFVQSEFEAETRRSTDAGLPAPEFGEFAAQFADERWMAAHAKVRSEVDELRKQADELRRIFNQHGTSPPQHGDDDDEPEEEGLVSNIQEMTFDDGSLDAVGPEAPPWAGGAPEQRPWADRPVMERLSYAAVLLVLLAAAWQRLDEWGWLATLVG